MTLHSIRQHVAGLLTGLLVLVFLASALVVTGAVTSAQAQQTTVSVKFRTALDPYGHWERHRRWGEVWVPGHVKRGWRPYTVGHWVYTDNWGWYWTAADAEADWAWIVYHYGRWVLDPDLGWVWVPGNEWAPAWVEWRYGDSHLGWAPQPPDVIRVEIRDNPRYWVFVEPRHLTDVRVVQYAQPATAHVQILQQTVIVNRTFYADNGGPRIAVNPGIPPAYVARVIGHPVRVYNVRPVVVAGTTSIPDAVEVRVGERGQRQQRPQVVVQETSNVVEASQQATAPQALGANEQGRLGSRPPKAAQGGAAAPTQNAQQGQPQQPQGQAAQQQDEQQQQKGQAAQGEQQQQQKNRAAQQQSQEKEGTASNQRQGEPSKAQAEQQKKGQPSKNEAAEQQKNAPSKSQAAEQQNGEPSKDRTADKQKREPSKNKAVEREKQEPSKRRAAEQEGQEPSKSRAAEQQQNRERSTRDRTADRPSREPSRSRAERQRSNPERGIQTEGRSQAGQGHQGAAGRSRHSEAPRAAPDTGSRRGGAARESTTGAASPQAGKAGGSGRSSPAASRGRGQERD